MKIMSTLLAAVALGAASAPAAIVTRPVDYEHNGVKLQGIMAPNEQTPAAINTAVNAALATTLAAANTPTGAETTRAEAAEWRPSK